MPNSGGSAARAQALRNLPPCQTPLRSGRQERPVRCKLERPVTLVYDNGQGLEFRRTITVDETSTCSRSRTSVGNNNTGTAPVTLYPYGLISRHGTPETLGYYILHEGLIGVLDGEQGLQEDHLQEDRRGKEAAELRCRDQCVARHHRQVLGRDPRPRLEGEGRRPRSFPPRLPRAQHQDPTRPTTSCSTLQTEIAPGATGTARARICSPAPRRCRSLNWYNNDLTSTTSATTSTC